MGRSGAGSRAFSGTTRYLGERRGGAGGGCSSRVQYRRPSGRNRLALVQTLVRLGGSSGRPVLPLLRKPPRIPDPGQHVDLRLEDGSWRQGLRALSEPSTAETSDVVWICLEDEYKKEGSLGEPRSCRRAVALGADAPVFQSTLALVLSVGLGAGWPRSHRDLV